MLPMTRMTAALHQTSITAPPHHQHRCDVIFRNNSPNYSVIAHRAFNHTWEFSCANRNLLGSKLILNNFSSADGLFIFSSATWNGSNQVFNSGFFISDATHSIHLAGCSSSAAEHHKEAKVQALNVALQTALNQNLHIQHIFILDAEINFLLHSINDLTYNWRITPWITNLRLLINSLQFPRIHIIPRVWMVPTIKLASIANNFHALTLFHWLMRSFLVYGFNF